MPGKNRVIGGGGFHHIAIKVHDFDSALRFYKALGFTEKTSWGEGDTRTSLLDTGDGNYFELFAGAPSQPRHPWGEGAAIMHVAIRTSDCAAALAKAEQAGAKITMPPRDMEIGPQKIKIRIGFVQAPGGEVIEFFENDPMLL